MYFIIWMFGCYFAYIVAKYNEEKRDIEKGCNYDFQFSLLVFYSWITVILFAIAYSLEYITERYKKEK